MGAVGAAVLGEQSAHANALAGIEVEGVAQKADGGFGLMIGQQLGKGQARVVIDGHVQRFGAGMLVQARGARPSPRNLHLLIAGHALDVRHAADRRALGVRSARRAEPDGDLASGSSVRAAECG